MSITDTIIHKMGDVGGRLRVKSALNPVLWLCGIVTLPFVIAILRYKIDSPVWLISIIMAPVIAAVGGFIYLLIVDRDKLQSEDYQLRKRSLELIQEKGQPFPIAAISLEAITNPQIPQLTDSNRDEGGDRE